MDELVCMVIRTRKTVVILQIGDFRLACGQAFTGREHNTMGQQQDRLGTSDTQKALRSSLM